MRFEFTLSTNLHSKTGPGVQIYTAKPAFGWHLVQIYTAKLAFWGFLLKTLLNKSLKGKVKPRFLRAGFN